MVQVINSAQTQAFIT